jgi:Ion channel
MRWAELSISGYGRINLDRIAGAKKGRELKMGQQVAPGLRLSVALRDKLPQSARLMSKLQAMQVDRDWLLTVLTAVLTLMIFVFAPLQAAGIFLFQTFAIAGLLVIIGGALLISGNRIALGLMSVAFVANFAVFFFRLFYPWPYNLHLLAGAWLIISVTLGIVVAQAVFASGRITYHRIVGAILLYLLIAVTFATLFAFIGLSIREAFKGIAFEDDSALASSLFYLSFVTLTSTGYGDIVPMHPLARSLCNIESIVGQLYPATILARLVTLELEMRS